jgi:hypothetical protein
MKISEITVLNDKNEMIINTEKFDEIFSYKMKKEFYR